MSTESHTDSPNESPLVRFLDNFLQEKNIKWVLTAGMMILLGSSLMMVTRGWGHMDATWKFLVVVGYTTGVFGAGSWTYHKLGLRKTGTGLLALSVLLIPLSFVAWYWIWITSTTVLSNGTALGLLLLNTAVASYAAFKIFTHFLQGRQTTFVVSYLLLSLAGAVAPCIRDMSIGDGLTWLCSAVLWLVFTTGVIKVNRHVFWLIEEHRQPRIFGFFPVLLLGAQFLLVFALNFASSIPHDWFGLACVLVAIPVLITADAVARVFQQRTGDIVRPIPWPIMLPTVIGLMLCAGGLFLALSGIMTSVPYAVVPTAALTAALMAVVARRTNKQAFVWAMLGCIVLAYNFSPVFFQELVRVVREQGASALNESRLPYAFYGLTYLPLIATMILVANRLGSTLFVRPMRQFCGGISILLLAVAFTHPKALFPVATAMTGLLAWQAIAFRVPRLALAGMISFLVASLGLAPFAAGVLEIPVAREFYCLFPALAATLLLIANRPLMNRIARLSTSNADATTTSIGWSPRLVSFITSVGLTTAWIVLFGESDRAWSTMVGMYLFGLLAVHSLAWVRPIVSAVVYGLAASQLLRIGISSSLAPNVLISLGILILGFQWFLSYLLARHPQHRVTRAWGAVNYVSAFGGLLFATLALALPNMAGELLGIGNTTGEVLRWARDLMLVIWCFDAARRPRVFLTADTTRFRWERFVQPIPATLGCFCVLGVVGCALVRIGGPQAVTWLPAAWALTAVVVLPLVQRLRTRLCELVVDEELRRDYFSLRAVTLPMDVVSCGLLVVFAALQLFVYTLPIIAAGYLGLAGLLVLAVLRNQPILRTTTAVVINWTILLTVVQVSSVGTENLMELANRYNADVLPVMAAMSAVSLLIWQRSFANSRQVADIALAQRVSLRLAGMGALLLTIGESSLPPASLFAALITFSLLAASELRAAIRMQNSSRVWFAEAITATCVGYLFWFNVFSLDQSAALFIPLGLGVAAHVSGLICARRPQAMILSRPLAVTGLWLPMATVVFGILRHVAAPGGTEWLGMNSLAILLAGGFYFWQAIERRSKGFAVLSAAVLNVAMLLLWNKIGLSDPQFYMIPIGITILAMVEVLKREIPIAWHNPLRYAGALTILVSPTFHIVDKSWLHLIALMVLATCVLLVSIGLRLRALMYTGTAFLIADLVAMVIFGGIDHPNLLWIAGIGFGAAVIVLGAICENNREKLLQRMRIVSARMQQWQ